MGLQDKDRLDEALDHALKRYGDVEPRPGLEGRVLASLDTGGLRLADRTSGIWRWGIAAAVTACVSVAVWVGVYAGGHESHRIQIGQTTSNVAPMAPKENTAEHASEPTATASAGTRVRRQIGHVARVPVRVAMRREPRLAQFPSPQPLSAQEQLLVNYVQHFPKDALLIAQRQATVELEMQKEMEKQGGRRLLN